MTFVLVKNWTRDCRIKAISCARQCYVVAFVQLQINCNSFRCNSHCKILSLFFTRLPFYCIILSEILPVNIAILLQHVCKGHRWHLVQKLNLFKERYLSWCRVLQKLFWKCIFNTHSRLVKIELSFEGIIFTRKNDTSVFLGWVLAWSGETLLFCRQLHKRAINNLRPGNYWTFPNTHGLGSFCSTNNLKDVSPSDWIQENWHLFRLRIYFIEPFPTLLHQTFSGWLEFWYSGWLLQVSWWQKFPYFRLGKAWSGGV